jgi:hypothetical protein
VINFHSSNPLAQLAMQKLNAHRASKHFKKTIADKQYKTESSRNNNTTTITTTNDKDNTKPQIVRQNSSQTKSETALKYLLNYHDPLSTGYINPASFSAIASELGLPVRSLE